jgi:hypothetical protein
VPSGTTIVRTQCTDKSEDSLRCLRGLVVHAFFLRAT